MHISIETFTANVPTSDEPQRRNNALAFRSEDLRALAKAGYRLISTVTLPSPEVVTIVDTLQREDE